MRIAWGCLPAVFAVALASPGIRLPGDDLGLRRFRTPPLSGDLRLGQTFTMTGNGLHAIELSPAVVGGVVSGDVRFELYELRDNQTIPVRVAEVLAEEVVRGPSYRFEFAPIPDSRDRTYRLDVVSAPATGVAFWATRGEGYADGSMHANRRERWADLAFQVDAPAPSIWAALMTLRNTSPLRAYVAMAALAAVWLLVGFVLRLLTTAPRESDRAASSPAA